MRMKTARWIRHTHIFSRDEYECSACGYCDDRPHAACPKCGARMKGSKYDPSWVDELEEFDAMLDDD